MFFRTAVTEKGEEPDPELRELLFMKNNYGPIGAKVLLRWKKGVFVPEPGQGTIEKAAAEGAAEQLFLSLLDRFPNVSNKSGVSYAPALFAKEAEAVAAKISKEALLPTPCAASSPPTSCTWSDTAIRHGGHIASRWGQNHDCRALHQDHPQLGDRGRDRRHKHR
jgi:hypothetical protein